MYGPEFWAGVDRRATELATWAAGGAAMDLGALERLHVRVTWSESAEFFEQMAPRIDGVLKNLRTIAERGAQLDFAPYQGREIGLLCGLKERGALNDASALLDTVLAPLPRADARLRVDLLREAAEIHRQCYRWQRAAALLDEASALAPSVPQDRLGSMLVDLLLARASLELERGRPDLAEPHVRSARESVERLMRENPADADAVDALCRTVHRELHLDIALLRPEHARSTLEALTARELSGELEATRTVWLPPLQNRGAVAVLADARATGPEVDVAVRWLHATASNEAVAAPERLFARTTLARHLLDRGALQAAADQLEAAAAIASSDSAAVSERLVVFSTMRLRHALAADLPAETREARASELDQRWRSLLATLASQPPSSTGLGPLFFKYRRHALIELMRAHVASHVDGARGAFEELLRVEAHGSMARLLRLEAPSVEAVQVELCGNRALVAYLPGHERTLAFIVTKANVRLTDLPVGSVELELARARLLDQLHLFRSGHCSRSTLDVAGAALAHVLLTPAVRAAIGDRPLVLVATDLLGYLPFELLPDTDGAPLGVGRCVSYLPSFPLGHWLATTARPPIATRPHVVIAACPDVSASAEVAEPVPPLPFGAAEEKLLVTAVTPATAHVLSGEAAAWSRVGGALTRDTGLLQILAHGVRDERRDDPQGLLLGDGTVLWPKGLEGVTLPPCVVFTACRAGRGRDRRGDDGRHLLAGASFLAGARSVVVPQLDVDYRATLAFSADLHHALWEHGQPPDEAMRAARAASWVRDPSAVDAFLFHAIGASATPLAAPPPGSSIPPVVFAAMALVVSGAWITRRTIQRARTAR